MGIELVSTRQMRMLLLLRVGSRIPLRLLLLLLLLVPHALILLLPGVKGLCGSGSLHGDALLQERAFRSVLRPPAVPHPGFVRRLSLLLLVKCCILLPLSALFLIRTFVVPPSRRFLVLQLVRRFSPTAESLWGVPSAGAPKWLLLFLLLLCARDEAAPAAGWGPLRPTWGTSICPFGSIASC